MFTDTVYASCPDQRAGRIFDKVTSHQTISKEETLVLILKAQNDHLDQLAETMAEVFDRMDRSFEHTEERIEQADKRFEQMASNFKWGLIAAMVFLSLLMTGLEFLF